MGLRDTYTMPISTITSTQYINSDSFNIFTCEDVKNATYIQKFAPAEIKKATHNYNCEYILGEGVQGTVFKGYLPNKQAIAVKRPPKAELSILSMKDTMKDFINEIKLLSLINNQNVVKLLGCCFENDIPSIVYEYAPNGSLYDHLFDAQKSFLLTWNHRLRIAVEVAHVLVYLHNLRVPIIHRDIKSRSILLDENYMAKVCDFGISKLLIIEQNEFGCSKEGVHFPTMKEMFFPLSKRPFKLDYVNTSVMGTGSYTDPEYLCSGNLYKESDVYSFGVVLVELLTRKEASRVIMSKGKMFEMVSIFLSRLKKDRLEKILDENLVKEGSMEEIKKVAHLTGRCLEMKAKDRPPMTQVVRELQAIRGF